ncbi:uncharacterized protein LOC141688978 [Apium graveolens]|uniref:uncharacterized protein LOC141688978 n=1 Tax=Apium graveolens TaxID=4045 RepID=UPI003D7AE0D0
MGETEVIMPSQSTIAFPLFTAPSSPARIEDYYFSTPATPGQISQFYREFDDFLINNSMISDVRRNSVCSNVPFDWEEKPGIPKPVAKMDDKNMYEDDFAFVVSQEMDEASLSADELFDGGKIRPQAPHFSAERSPRPQKSAESEIRGRERSVSTLSSSRSGHRSTRSLSPMRVSQYPWEEENRQQQKNHQKNSKIPSSTSKPSLTSSVSALSSSSLKGLRKWKLKDFFLFRSASEGRASNKADPIKKYASLFKKHDDIKSSSFRSIDKNPGTSTSGPKRKGHVSAHELHYTMNRAVSEDMKKKTFLPYKQGILGRLAFNPAVNAIANGFGFSRK